MASYLKSWGRSKRGVQRGELVGGDAPALVNAHPLVCAVVLGIPLACPGGVVRLTTFIFKGEDAGEEGLGRRHPGRTTADCPSCLPGRTLAAEMPMTASRQASVQVVQPQWVDHRLSRFRLTRPRTAIRFGPPASGQSRAPRPGHLLPLVTDSSAATFKAATSREVACKGASRDPSRQ